MMREGIARATGLSLSEISTTLRFLGQVPAFLRRPFSDAEARALVRDRLSGREAAFLALVRRAVYERSDSPYRTLLREAGCELGDLARLVQGEGVEGALQELLRRGVYLTVSEFKGRVPVRRGATTFTVDPARLRNAAMQCSDDEPDQRQSRGAGARAHGSARRARPCRVSLPGARRSGRRALAPRALGRPRLLADRHHAPVLRGRDVAGSLVLAGRSGLGRPCRRRTAGADARSVSRPWLAARRLPGPTYVRPTSLCRSSGGCERSTQAGGVPHIQTFPSSAVRTLPGCRGGRPRHRRESVHRAR